MDDFFFQKWNCHLVVDQTFKPKHQKEFGHHSQLWIYFILKMWLLPFLKTSYSVSWNREDQSLFLMSFNLIARMKQLKLITDLFFFLHWYTVSLFGKRSGLPNAKDSSGKFRVVGLALPTSSLRIRIFVFLPSRIYSAFFKSDRLLKFESI